MKNIKTAVITMMTFLMTACPVFADIVDVPDEVTEEVEEEGGGMILPIIIAGAALIVLIVIIKVIRKK